ncbi:MAG: GRAM domain-containing protein [Veillonellales bacterium]
MEEQERILKKGLANAYCDKEAYHGALYLTNDRLVFVGYILDISRKFLQEIPLTHIREINPAKTFGIIPNVIKVVTIKGFHIKFILSSRDEWLKAIKEQIIRIG